MSATLSNSGGVPPSHRRTGAKQVIQGIVFISVQALVLFFSAGNFRWLRGWLYFGVYLTFTVTLVTVIFRVNPELIDERGRVNPDTKGFDKVFVMIYGSMYFIVVAVAGLDVRYHWSLMPLSLAGVGVVLFATAGCLSMWASVVNPFFETTVRIQKERGHCVITSGPYQYVRHPGYLGGIFMEMSIPLLLGSWVTFVPALFVVVLFIVRTVLEDRTLREELPGYREYAAHTRYRLLPGVW